MNKQAQMVKIFSLVIGSIVGGMIASSVNPNFTVIGALIGAILAWRYL